MKQSIKDCIKQQQNLSAYYAELARDLDGLQGPEMRKAKTYFQEQSAKLAEAARDIRDAYT